VTLRLRDYQIVMLERVYTALGAHRSVVMQVPCGSGKTRMAAEMLGREVFRGKSAIFLAHLDTLVDDTHERLVAAGVPAGIVQAGKPSCAEAPVQVCSLQTLHARGARPKADLLIVDECHRAASSTVRGILSAYPNARIIGLTATPERGDGQALGDVFEVLVEGPSVRWLTERGFLVPSDVIGVDGHDGGGLAMDPVDAYQRFTSGQRAMIFTSSVEHAKDVTTRFARAGVEAECVVGETSSAVRTGVRERVSAGTLRALVGVSVFLEGFDLPAVDAVILARSFTVVGAYLQAIGRGLRPSPSTNKTKCTVVDLVGAWALHGLPDEDRAWSLEGRASRRTETIPALARCPECLAIFRPSSRCPRCEAPARRAARLPRVLNRAERMQHLSTLPQYERDARYLAQLERVARERIRLPATAAQRWARRAFLKRFSREPEVRSA
jgi:DNA repair protein RadD